MILQAIAPMFFGDMADAIGRRPVYILDFIIYLGANIGLALQRDYPALLVLRMVQSLGSSAVIALGSGVVADISHAGERGMYMSAVNIGAMCGPAIGPVIGGIISNHVGWWWIFWLLAIMAGVFLIPLVLFFPETGRRVVGNGSIPARGLNASVLQLLRRPKGKRLPPRPRRKKVIPNPLRCLTIILHKDLGIVLFTNSIFYTAFYTITASIPSLFTDIYHFNSLQIGLCYLPFGVGCAIASFGAGKLVDRDYRVIAKKRNIVMDKIAGEDMATFPIEHARLHSVWWVVGIYSATIIAYGWVLQAETHLVGPLVLQFMAGLFGTGVFNILSTFVVDLYPMRPSSATASNNLVRCLMGAGGTAVIQSMINKMGRGWCFTFVGLVVLGMLPLLWMEWKWGMQWRTARVQRAKLEKEGHERQKAMKRESKRERKEKGKSPIRA
jgi:multidrug resistance protein